MSPSKRKECRSAGSGKNCDKPCPMCGELNGAEDGICNTCEQPKTGRLVKKNGKPCPICGELNGSESGSTYNTISEQPVRPKRGRPVRTASSVKVNN